MAWQEAREHCQKTSGGDLTSIPDEDTNKFLKTLTLEKANVWVGGHRSNDNGEEWVWSDETPWQFENWFEGKPDNLGGDQTHLSFNIDKSGHWDDDFEFEEKSFLCSRHKGLRDYINLLYNSFIFSLPDRVVVLQKLLLQVCCREEIVAIR